MAKITIEELSESLKTYLDGLGLTEAQVQELIDKMQEEVIGNKEELATSDKTSIVAAINELFQNANNGKELIASAIGEPLVSTDTFSAMSTDINGLLSTFKTNMMNNGVTVEAGDKFKALIDKIATLADSEGKGFKFVEGTFTTYSSGTEFLYDIELDFNPTIIISKIHHVSDIWTGDVQTGTTICIYNSLSNTDKYCCGWLDEEEGDYGQFIEIDTVRSDNKFTFTTSVQDDTYFSTTFSEQQYWAIGVGEEDTTLRDSLASILEEEGVEVTDDDDMASLITKVDEEFDNKNANSGLNIISATELPATGKENQICVITDNPNQNIKITNLMSEATDSSYIYGILGDGTSNIAGNITIGDKVSVIYHMDGFFQNNTRLLSYIYRDGSWQSFTKSGIYIITNKEYSADSLIYGTFPTQTNTATGDVSFEMIENYGLEVANYSSDMYYYSFLPTPIDISAFNTVVLKYSISSYGNTPAQRLQIVCSTTKPTSLSGRCTSANLPSYCEDDFAYSSKVYGNTNLSGDLEGLSGTYYIGIMHYYEDSYGCLFVHDFYLE